MRITFPYAGIPDLEVPDANLLGYHHPKRVPQAPPPEELVARALASPVGAPRLGEMVRAGNSVLVLVDDVTRPTPQDALLPPVMEELRRGGVVVLVTPAPEGAARTHPRLVSIGFRPHEEIFQMVREGKLPAGAAAAALANVGRVIKGRATGIMVSPGINPDVQRKLGFRSAKTPQEALEQRRSR